MKVQNKKQAIVLGSAFVVLALFGAAIAAAHGFGFMGVTEEERTAMQNAVENGDYAAWRAAMESQLSEENFNAMQERHLAMQGHMEKVQAALEAGDYGAWKTAMAEDGRNPKITEVITEDNFATFVKMHEAKKAGDFDTAKALAEELNLGVGMGQHAVFGKGIGCGRF